MLVRMLTVLWVLVSGVALLQGKYAQALDLSVKFLTLFAVYLMLVVLLTLACQLLVAKKPVWADRLAILLGWLVSGENSRVTRLAIHKNDFARADQIWSGVSQRLDRLQPGVALALATNYSASLSGRGQYTRARDLLRPLDPSKVSRAYRRFVPVYWLNLSYYHLQLGQLQDSQRCLDNAQKIPGTSRLLLERLEGLRILLSHEAGDFEEALRLLRQNQRKRSFAALMLARLGQPEEAAQRLPEPESSGEPAERCYYHLAKMWLASDPAEKRAELRSASQTGSLAGLVAWHAAVSLADFSYLEQARQQDVESIWTRRAEEVANPC
ncbi:MAG: hypothetical protein U0931_25670 [Vulcanimicrobiota bacterium]